MTILRTWKLLWLLAAGLLLQPNAHAAGNCTVTSIAFTGVTYNNTALTATGTVNYTCSRSSNGTDGSPFTLQVTASDGLYYGSNTRNGGNGANRLAYNLSTTAAWGNGMPGLGNAHAVSVPFPTTLPISITVATTCSITSAPGTLNMAYTSFQSIAGTGNVPFSAQCSNGGPFRMSLSPTNGTLLGVAYTLRLGTSAGSATNISSTTTYNLTGTGSAVTYYVNATAASGQVGTCASGTCQALSPPHTLLIEY